MKITSFGRGRYFLTFIDDFSKKVWIYILKSKSKYLERFKELKVLVEIQPEYKIKVFLSNNDSKYISKRFGCFLKKHGIKK